MKKILTALASLALLAVPLAARADTIDPARARSVLAKVVDEGIRPGYHAFQADAAGMSRAMTALCDSPSPAARQSAEAAFSALVTSWGKVEIIRLGPAIEENRFERILFYPDRKSLGLKQMQAILAKEDQSALTGLSGKSVAVQGLTALDYVLVGKGAETLETEKNGFRCRFGASIAGNLEAIAGELTAAWDAPDGIARSWKEPGPDNPLYRDDREALTALLGIFVHGAEAVRDQRIEQLYKGNGSDLRPKSAVFWRSGNTWTALDANLSGLQTLWVKADMESLLPDDARSVSSSILFLMKSMQGVARKLDPDLDRLAADPAGRKRLDFLLLNGRDLILRLSESYGKAIGLGAGFSFADGD